MLILDACRYDYFEDENLIDGRLSKVISRGSHSGEFTEKNLTGRDLSDIVYVTANPNISRINKETFYTVENCLRRWNSEVGTVMPRDVVDATREVFQKYPNKRLIVHFMQPHQPYLGETADQINRKLDAHGYDSSPDGDVSVMDNDSLRDQWGMDDTWVALRDGVLSVEEVRSAYRETLNIVLSHAKELLESLDGKSVITADHGEYLGEWKFPYLKRKVGHPWEFTPGLRFVPWLEIEGESRREIVAEEPIGFERLDDEVIQERLRDFGYLPE